jgi:hypothetical protein
MEVLARLMWVRMRLYHVLYVSYLVPAARVRPLVPDALPLAKVSSESVFVSLVAMQCSGVRSVFIPWPSFKYQQLNVRTYVKDPDTGRPAVYFFQSGVTSRMTAALTGLFGLSWQNIVLMLSLNRSEDGRYEEYAAKGSWHGDFSLLAQESAMEPEHGFPFDGVEALIDHLTGPLIGFAGAQGRTRRFEIRHKALGVQGGRLCDINFPFLAAMRLVEVEEMREPHNVLLVPEAEFTVCLPPRMVRPA